MNQQPHAADGVPDLELDGLLTDDQRRVTVEDHAAFRGSISRPTDRFDEIDHAVADARPAQRRSDREVSRVLDILDELDREGGPA